MARLPMGMLLVALILACSLGSSNAETPDCTDALNSMLGCLAYVTGQSATPTPDCCNGVTSVFETEPICLCEILLSGSVANSVPGFQTALAEQLPGACQIQGANVSLCSALINGTSPVSPPIVPGAPPPASNTGFSILIPAAFTYFAVAALGLFLL